MSEENPLHLCSTEKPELYQAVRLFFEDEHETLGHWTGRIWWTMDHHTAPLYWQNLESNWTGSRNTLHSLRN